MSETTNSAPLLSPEKIEQYRRIIKTSTNATARNAAEGVLKKHGIPVEEPAEAAPAPVVKMEAPAAEAPKAAEAEVPEPKKATAAPVPAPKAPQKAPEPKIKPVEAVSDAPADKPLTKQAQAIARRQERLKNGTHLRRKSVKDPEMPADTKVTAEQRALLKTYSDFAVVLHHFYDVNELDASSIALQSQDDELFQEMYRRNLDFIHSGAVRII